LHVGELAPGLWFWTARHPDWQPGLGWGAEVRCFYAEAEDATLVVDPLVPRDEADRFWNALDRDVERRGVPLAVLLTQAAHARSAGDVTARYGAAVWGHEKARGKVGGAEFHAVRPGDALPGGAHVLPFDQDPGGSGTPLYLSSHRAAATGDVFIAVEGELRVWWGHGAEHEEWYGNRLLPSLRRWLELPIERVLVAHGDPAAVGPDELAAALARPPHRIG
jgi:hypothetical protein